MHAINAFNFENKTGTLKLQLEIFNLLLDKFLILMLL